VHRILQAMSTLLSLSAFNTPFLFASVLHENIGIHWILSSRFLFVMFLVESRCWVCNAFSLP